MHMAFDIKSEMFSIRADGGAVARDALLDWDARDRVGIVVDRGFGALDAVLMLTLCATAFYDSGRKRRMRPLYPDMYLFHAGGPWGCHGSLDFAPDRKEIRVADDPRELLRAINQVGITHLLIPERTPRPVKHRFKEPEAAIDRLKQVFVYGPDLAKRDISLTVTDIPVFAGTVQATLDPVPLLAMLEEQGAGAQVRAADKDELAILIPSIRARLDEVPPEDGDRVRHVRRIETALAEGSLTEWYRTEDSRTALNMLHAREG